MIKCLHEDLSLLPRTHRENPAERHTLVIPKLGRWRSELVGQPV